MLVATSGTTGSPKAVRLSYSGLAGNTAAVIAALGVTAEDRAPTTLPITHAYVGSCTNGRISDLREVARILRGRRVADGVQMLVVPATQAVWRQAAAEGLMEVFVDAGATVSYPSCGACLGMHTGVLGPGDVCISSSNRNFVGRMGDPTAQIYLASPATVAASAVAGVISDPRRYGPGGEDTQAAD